MAVDEKILGKIKKCLALAQSDNPNEAATALRQAQALMAQHGLTTEALLMSEIGEASCSSQTMARNKPATWEASLASLVGTTFNCKILVSTMVPKAVVAKNGRRVVGALNEGQFIFVGPKSQVELASYTAEVLIRKCKRARAAWITATFESFKGDRRVRGHKTRLGEQFAMGWVMEIGKVVRDFAGSSEIENAIDIYMSKRTTSEAGQNSNVRRAKEPQSELDTLALVSGARQARDESILRPVGANTHAALEFDRA